jgi:hypothetical protein
MKRRAQHLKFDCAGRPDQRAPPSPRLRRAEETCALPRRDVADTSKGFASRPPLLQQSATLTRSVSEETASADDLGDLRRHRFLPGFVAAGDALEDVP